MRQKPLDLIVITILAVLNVVFALLPIHNLVIGIALALPLVFISPGYALTEALFHKRSLDASHRFLLSLGLSLVTDVLCGLILNLLPAGFKAGSWATLLGLLTAVLSLLATFLRKQEPANGRHPMRFHLPIYGGVLFGLAISIAVASILYAYIGVQQQPHPGFTQFWMLPSVQTGKKCAVRLGVNSFESTSVTYRIAMTINGTEVTSWPSILLAPQQEWNRVVSVTAATSVSVFIDARLYRLDKPGTLYREVRVTMSGCSTSQSAATNYPRLDNPYTSTFFAWFPDKPYNANIALQEITKGNEK